MKLHPLTQAIVDEQKRLQLNGPQMATMLGVAESTWSRVKRGIRQPGPKIVNGVLNSFHTINVTKLLREAARERR